MGEYFQAKQKKSEVLAFREKRAEALLQFVEDTISSEPRMTIMALDRVVEYLEVLKPAQYPAIAGQAAALWEKTGRSLPSLLRPQSASGGPPLRKTETVRERVEREKLD